MKSNFLFKIRFTQKLISYTLSFVFMVFLTAPNILHAQATNNSPAQFSLNTLMDQQNQACAVSLCGTQNLLSHPFETQPSLSESTLQNIQPILKKNLENYMGRLIRQYAHLDQSIKKLQNSTALNFTQEQIGFLQAYSYIQRITELWPALEISNQSYILNKDKLKLILKDSSDAEINAVSNLAPTIIAIYSLQSYENYDFETLMRLIYQTNDIKTAQISETNVIKTSLNQFSKIIPIYYLFYQPDDLILKKAASGAALTTAEKKYFVQLSLFAKSINLLAQDNVISTFAKLPIKIDEFKQKLLQNYPQTALGKTFQTPTSIKNTFEPEVTKCLNKMAYSYAALPTLQQIQNFQSLYQEVTKEAQVLAQEKASASIPNLFQLEVILPETKDEAINSWKTNLDLLTKRYDQSYQQIKNSVDNEQQKDAYTLILLSLFKNKKGLFDESDSFCDRSTPAYLNDAAIPSLNSINLSWPTIVHPEIGLGIVAHELGHIASARLGDYPLRLEKSCLVNKTKTDLYLEEDFADLFSSEIYNRFGGKIQNTQLAVMGCGLLEINPTSGLYQNLNTTNINANDPHSSGFYRLLAIASMTNRLTDTCKSRLDQMQETRFKTYCSWKK